MATTPERTAAVKRRAARRSLGDEEAGTTLSKALLSGSGSGSGVDRGGVDGSVGRERGDTELSSFVTGADSSVGAGGAFAALSEAAAAASSKGKEAAAGGGGSGGLLRREALLSFLLALVLFALVPPTERHDFRRLEANGFALCAATAPGAHWGNWRSLTRCDCKSFHHCYASLLASNETASRTMKLMKVATCQLLTGQDDECQLGHSQLRKDLVQFRLFLPELVLRLRLAADFRPWVRIPCYWLMACALLEICLFLLAATRLQWRRLRAKGLREEAIWEQELLVWAFLVGWHELLSYLVHYLYYDSHTLCDGSGLFFRDAMTLFTMVQVVQRAVLGGGPNQHRNMILKAEQRYLDLEGRPLWVRVIRDPRIGAFHAFSGLDLKIMEDPVGFFNAGMHWATVLWRWGLRALSNVGLVEGPQPAAVAGAGASGGVGGSAGGGGGGKYD